MNALLLSLFLAQANMGLTVPTPGVTPGPTYATNVSNDLVIIDAHNHTPGNGVLVPTAGLNINALLPFNGFGATGFNSCTGTACGITVPYLGTFVGDAGNFASVTADGGTFANLTAISAVDNSVTADAGLFYSVTADAGFFGTLTVAGGGLNAITVPGNSGINAAGNLTLSSGGSQVALLQTGASAFQLNGGMTITQSISESSAATALTLKGSAAATGGVGTVLDNQTTQTSGKITSFRTGGTEKAYIDFAGNLDVSAGVAAITTGPLALAGAAASAGVSVNVTNAVDVGATGLALEILGGGAAGNQFAVSGRGHLIPQGTAPTTPTSANFNANYRTVGSVTGITLTGSDASMILTFTTGTTVAAITAGSVLVTITLANAYSSTQYGGSAGYNKTPATAAECAALTVVPSAAGTIQVVAMTGLTPVLSTQYVFYINTTAAGATY